MSNPNNAVAMFALFHAWHESRLELLEELYDSAENDSAANAYHNALQLFSELPVSVEFYTDEEVVNTEFSVDDLEDNDYPESLQDYHDEPILATEEDVANLTQDDADEDVDCNCMVCQIRRDIEKERQEDSRPLKNIPPALLAMLIAAAESKRQ